MNAGEEHIPAIEKIIADYPYFQTAHLLYAKALHNSGSLHYHTALKRTAVIAGDRGLLYRLIQQKPVLKATPEPVVEEKVAQVTQEEPLLQKDQRTVSNISITYDVIPTLKTEIRTVKEQEPEPARTEEKAPTLEEQKQEPIQELQIAKPNNDIPKNLDEVVMKPVVDAYVETEVLKITEKEAGEEVLSNERSFGDWLQAISKGVPKVQSLEPEIKKMQESGPKLKSRTEKQQQLDRLLSEDLRISKPSQDKDFYAATEKTRSSVIENEDLVTETLAKIYVMQGNRSKAIRAYEILSLKYPEKSAYFASLITEIKNTIK